MTQRPVVNLIVQDSEVPVGSRTRGPHSRLLVVEGIGDMVLRNGQRLVCLKMRRDPAMGLDNTDYSWSRENTWHAENPSNTADSYYAGQQQGAAQNAQVVSNMAPLPVGVRQSPAASQGIVDVMADMPATANTNNGYYQSAAAANMKQASPVDTVAVELAQGRSIAELENKWEAIRAKNRTALNGYNPYFSIDTVAEGGMPDLFRLRIGPVEDIRTADSLCSKLSKKGVTCSVVKTQ